MSDPKHSDDVQQKLSFLDKIINFFRSKDDIKASLRDDQIHLEPKYWPEVREFIDNLNSVIESHTIQDDNIHRVNQRIVDYILEEINKKGQIENIEQRYSALTTLSDRILSHNLNKLVGVKENTAYNTDFSDTVNQFKFKLETRKRLEQETKTQ